MSRKKRPAGQGGPARRMGGRSLHLLAAAGLLLTGGCGGPAVTTAPEPSGVPTGSAGSPSHPANGAPAAPSDYGDWLRRAEGADPQTLNFVRAQDRFGDMLGRLISDTLVQYDRQLGIVGRLASSWEFSADHRTLTFHMRPTVRWHDGAPVGSADAAYTLERIRDPASQAVSRFALFENVERVETPDPLTLVVRYREPYAAALDAWAGTPLIPRHLYTAQKDFLNNPQCVAPVGCGPFRFVEWSKGQQVVLEANDDYWDGRPCLDRLVFKIMPQDSTRLQALLLGEIDECALTPEQHAAHASSPSFPQRLKVLTYTVPYLWYIAWNQDGSNPFFTDPRVRRAMTLALDRPGYVATVWHGHAALAASTVPPGTWAYSPDPPPLPHDPARARELLDQSGWVDADGDGVRERNGVPFEFTLMYPATGQTNDQMAAFFQANLARVGVRMNLGRLEFRVMLDRTRTHAYQAFMSGLMLDPDPDAYDLFHSSQIRGGSNTTSYRNEEMDRLLVAARTEFDRERRRKLYVRMQEILAEHQPFTCVFFPKALVAIDRRFRGVEPSPRGLYTYWPGVTRWWVPRAEQRFPRAQTVGAR